MEWYHSHDNLMTVGQHLVDEGGMTAEELLHFFEKPWNWTEVWFALQTANKEDDAQDHQHDEQHVK
jgi:hypothetical protein